MVLTRANSMETDVVQTLLTSGVLNMPQMAAMIIHTSDKNPKLIVVPLHVPLL